MIWLNTQDAAERARRKSRVTIRRLCESGVLHGHQRKRGGPWVIAKAALDVHLQGGGEAAQIRACGCRALRAVS